MKYKNPFLTLSKFELSLWLCSSTVIILSFFLSAGSGIAETIASLIGVTALIFVAKGYVIGQVLCVIFALLYGIISFHFRYYGEMITANVYQIALLACAEDSQESEYTKEYLKTNVIDVVEANN